MSDIITEPIFLNKYQGIHFEVFDIRHFKFQLYRRSKLKHYLSNQYSEFHPFFF